MAAHLPTPESGGLGQRRKIHPLTVHVDFERTGFAAPRAFAGRGRQAGEPRDGVLGDGHLRLGPARPGDEIAAAFVDDIHGLVLAFKQRGAAGWYLVGCLLYTSPSPRDRTR